MKPLVTIIAICYNHENFVEAALRSVLDQSYENIELIVVDDASTDKSVDKIKELLKDRSDVKTIFNEQNKGICRSFNSALRLAEGEYIIDFATDDVFLPSTVAMQIEAFLTLDDTYGVVHGNALHIDENGNALKSYHSESASVPEGDVYRAVLARHFICPPTLMFRKSVIERLRGYDDSLAYEDFDFWVRSSRLYKYYYINEVLIKRRITVNSLTTRKSSQDSALTTYKVCEKALNLNRTKEEHQALAQRIKHEMRFAYFSNHYVLTERYFQLLERFYQPGLLEKLFRFFAKKKWNLSLFYKYYSRTRNSR